MYVGNICYFFIRMKIKIRLHHVCMLSVEGGGGGGGESMNFSVFN